MSKTLCKRCCCLQGKGGCKTAYMTLMMSLPSYLHDITIGSGVMTLHFEKSIWCENGSVFENKGIGEKWSLHCGRDYKNLPRLCTGTGKSTWVSKICSPRQGLPNRGRCKSLTWGWISLSLCEVVVDYFSPTTFNSHYKTPFSLSKTTSKHFLVRKRRQLG